MFHKGSNVLKKIEAWIMGASLQVADGDAEAYHP